MKRYFEYEFNEEIKKRLLKYYHSKGSIDHFGNENGKRKMALKLKRIEKQIPYSQNDRICDVGCADGALLGQLRGRYQKAVGLDISKNVIDRCRLLGYGNVDFHTYDGAFFQFEGLLFDKIFMMDVLEHAFEPDKLMNSVYRNLKGGGLLIMQVPSTGWLSELIFGKYHYGHLRYYDEEYLRKYLKERGFEVKYTETFNSVPFSAVFLKIPAVFSILNAVCRCIPHKMYPYYGSVVAIAEKSI